MTTDKLVAKKLDKTACLKQHIYLPLLGFALLVIFAGDEEGDEERDAGDP